MHQRRLMSWVLMAILIMTVGIVSITAWAGPPISETFRGTTATNWTLSGNAYLTAPSLDADGSGWLRLTDASDDQSGTALYDVAFNSSDGTQIVFWYATYGGTGADGISFFLIDGTAPASYGGVGGSLGYSYRLLAPAGPGVTGGVLGVGLDEWGNFANSLDQSMPNPYGEGGLGSSTYPGVTVRGSGTGNSDYDFVNRVFATIETGSRAGAKKVQITITPTLRLTVIHDGTTVIDDLDVSAYVTVPETLKMGFSSSTGASTNIHEIRDLTVGGASPSTTVLTTVPDPSVLNTNACFQATVTGDDGGDPEGIVEFYNGTTYLGEATIVAGVAEFCYNGLALGNHTINAEYQGDSKYSGSVGTDPHEVINIIPTTTTVVDTPDPSYLGTEACFTATVTPDSLPPAPGTVTFLEGATVLGTATLSGGVATFCTSALTLGTHTITARYEENLPYLTSSGTTDHLVLIDVNGDGVDDVLDVRLVFAHVAGCSLLSGVALDRADVDSDGDVDMDDAVIYAEYVIGIRP